MRRRPSNGSNSCLPPAICATDAETRRDIKGRFPVTSYVPVNDSTLSRKVPSTYETSKLKAAGLALLPEHRSRQPRKFPVAIPHDPVVHLVWEEAVPEQLQSPLSELCSKVVSIGHSASFVQMWPTDSPPPPNLVPVDGVAVHRLRVFGPGKLAYLKARCARDEVLRYRDAVHAEASMKDAKKEVVLRRKEACKGLKGNAKKEAEAPFKEELAAIEKEMAENRAVLDAFGQRVPNTMRPEPGLWQGYGRPPREESPEIAGSVFDSNLIVMNLFGKRIGLHSTLKLAQAARGALLSNISGPIPEWISGHGPAGARSESPHLAMFPLPFVGREHADGRIMGLAFALPRQVDKTEAGMLLEPLLRDPYGAPQSVKLFKGKWLECEITVETRETPPWSLRTDVWTAPSRLWASVTPVVLDRHFDGRDKWDKAAETVKDSCERIGLPRPRVGVAPSGFTVARRAPFPRISADPAKIRQWKDASLPRGGPFFRTCGRTGRCRRGPVQGIRPDAPGRPKPIRKGERAMNDLHLEHFCQYFEQLWQWPPFAWQKALAKRALESEDRPWPQAIALPTASGKTACIDIAVFAMAARSQKRGDVRVVDAPRRIFFVVDRRVIVDEAYERAAKIAERLKNAETGVLKEVADRLRELSQNSVPLMVFQLRGGMYRSDAWSRSPIQPEVVATTVDQIGSRLLFRAYGRSPKAWPIQAGLAGNDSLILLDEAHCSRPFMETLHAVQTYRRWAETPPVLALSRFHHVRHAPGHRRCVH